MREIKFRGWYGKDKGMLEPQFNGFINNIFATEAGIYMQYTGLKDVNGKEVFEGDIVTHEDGEYWFVAVVEWMEYEFCFRIIKPFEDIYDFDDWYENGTLDVQVVGNIHDNPELLENPK